MLNLSVGEEAVVATVKVMSVVRGSAIQHVRIVLVIRKEGLAKLAKVDAAVLVSVVALEEQAHLIGCWEDSDSSEALSQVSLADSAVSQMVKDNEGIMQIEVRLHCQGSLSGFKLTLEADEITERVDESIFLWQVQGWLTWAATMQRWTHWWMSHW